MAKVDAVEAVVTYSAIVAGSAIVAALCHYFIRSFPLAVLSTVLVVDGLAIVGDVLWLGYFDPWWIIAVWGLSGFALVTSVLVGIAMQRFGLAAHKAGK